MVGVRIFNFNLDVKYPGLVDLHNYSYKHLNLFTNDPYHPSKVSHYGKIQLVRKILELDEAFGKALNEGAFDETNPKDPEGPCLRPDKKKILLNDMSLPWGGLFKQNGDISRKEHNQHRWGDCFDISRLKGGEDALYWYWLKTEGKKIVGNMYDEGKVLHFYI
ncbi:hypothetical protein LLH00_17890 [bacterium]|nr:hypothetical protein [bacterium]